MEGIKQGLEAMKKPNIVPFERDDIWGERIS